MNKEYKEQKSYKTTCELGGNCYLYDKFGRYSPQFPKCSGQCSLSLREKFHNLIIELYRSGNGKINLEKIG